MKTEITCLLFAVISFMFSCNSSSNSLNEKSELEPIVEITNQLRHVVLFKFKVGTEITNIQRIEEAFSELPSKISGIKDFEWGTNNSPENLNKGFTHCFFLTFESEKDRDEYLVHPDHVAFGDILGPHLEDVLVVDYWTSEDGDLKE